MKRKKGEVVSLYCQHCSWSTEVPMDQTAESAQFPCAHCGQTLYWHACPTCGLRYVGDAIPRCAICDEPGLDELDTSSS